MGVLEIYGKLGSSHKSFKPSDSLPVRRMKLDRDVKSVSLGSQLGTLQVAHSTKGTFTLLSPNNTKKLESWAAAIASQTAVQVNRPDPVPGFENTVVNPSFGAGDDDWADDPMTEFRKGSAAENHGKNAVQFAPDVEQGVGQSPGPNVGGINRQRTGSAISRSSLVGPVDSDRIKRRGFCCGLFGRSQKTVQVTFGKLGALRARSQNPSHTAGVTHLSFPHHPTVSSHARVSLALLRALFADR